LRPGGGVGRGGPSMALSLDQTDASARPQAYTRTHADPHTYLHNGPRLQE
jgi:hypothetical protein